MRPYFMSIRRYLRTTSCGLFHFLHIILFSPEKPHKFAVFFDPNRLILPSGTRIMNVIEG